MLSKVLFVVALQLFRGDAKVVGVYLYNGKVGDLNSNIGTGSGYSQDTQQVTPQRCYNSTISSTSGQQSFVQLDTAMTYSDLENSLKVSVSVSTSFWMFSADAQASYMRSIQDKDYSLSLNYYQYATNGVNLQLAGSGTKALTESGKGFYKNGKDPYFGIICGDNYISSYQQGALLTMGLVIKFSSSDIKQAFQETVGVSFGSIFSASETIKTFVEKYNTSGSATLQAFQVGGDPSKLSQLLSEDGTGKYYAMTCSLTAIDDCVHAASGLLAYAKNNFSTQFSFENNTGLTPLGLAFTQYNSIQYIGLTPPKSLVSEQVLKDREELSYKLKENEYYKEKLYPFLNKGYPVTLDDSFLTKANSILSKANSNINILMQVHNGAEDCYNFPDKCSSIKSSMSKQFSNITANDLKFLDDIKYTISTFGGVLYGTAAPNSPLSVKFTSTDIQQKVERIYNITVNFNYYSFSVDTTKKDTLNFLSNSSDGVTYTGGVVDDKGNLKCSSTFVIQLSPFYFEAYNVTKMHTVRSTLAEKQLLRDSSLTPCEQMYP